MKKTGITFILLLLAGGAFAREEVGPEGEKLAWFLFIILVPLLIYYLYVKISKKDPLAFNIRVLRKKKRLESTVEKDRLYYPDYLKLTVKNTGNIDVDLDYPVITFSRLWKKRKFKLKGFSGSNIYPLYLEKGRIHTLKIDLNQFYRHDKRLKRYTKAVISLKEVSGKSFKPVHVYLRKTLLH